MNEKPGCPGTAAKLPYSPGNQKLTPPSSAHELIVDNKTEITNRNALNKSRTLDATNRMRLIVVKTCDAQIHGPMRKLRGCSIQGNSMESSTRNCQFGARSGLIAL